MIFRPERALHYILGMLVLLALAACQARPDGQHETAQVTLTAFPTAELATSTPTRTPTPAPSPTPTLPAYLDVDPSSLSGVAVEFWHPWQGDLAEMVDQLAREFTQVNEWGIRVSPQPFYSAGGLAEQVEAGLAGDPPELPGVVAATTEQLAAWSADEGIVADLSGYLEHPQAGLSADEVAAFEPVFWNQERQGAFQTGLPLLRTARVLFYNQTWASELGFDSSPKTPREFKEQACAAAVANNELRQVEKFGTGGWLVDSDPQTLLSWLAVFGAQAAPEAGGVAAYQFESDEGQQALAFLRGMLDDGCAWLGRTQTQYDYFASRTTLFYAGYLQDIYIQKDINAAAGSSDRWTVLPFPGQDGQPVVYTGGYSLGLLGLAGGLPADEQADRQRMAGWLFIRWLVQPRNQARLTEALPSIPVSGAVEAQLADYHRNFPWNMILPLREGARPVPGQASWRVVRRLVEDAAWQVYYLPAEQIDLILPQLDAYTQELLEGE